MLIMPSRIALKIEDQILLELGDEHSFQFGQMKQNYTSSYVYKILASKMILNVQCTHTSNTLVQET